MQRSEWVRFFALLYFYTAIGLGYGQIMARMPELTAAAHAHEADVGLALFCMGLGSIAGFAIAPRVQNRFPSATVLTWSMVIFMLLLPVTPLAFSPQTLCIMFALFGACFAFCEVSVNLQGVALEHLLKRSALSRLQAGYSLGGLGGSVIGALLVKFSVPLFDSLAVTCLILIVFILLLRRFLLPEEGWKVKFVGPAPRPPALPFKVWWAGIIIALIFGVEGTCAEWSALYLTEVKEALPAQAALAFGTFALSVTLVRFMGDTLKDRFGPSRLVLCSIVTAALGQLIVLLSPYTLSCLVGYALTGAGIGPLMPTIISSLSHGEILYIKRAVSIMIALGYAGLLVLPPLVGFISAHVGLSRGLWISLIFLTIILSAVWMVRDPVAGKTE